MIVVQVMRLKVVIKLTNIGAQDDISSPERLQHKRQAPRGKPFTEADSSHSWTAAEVIKATGYPLERHEVTTEDGYVLLMERLPRHGTFLSSLCACACLCMLHTPRRTLQISQHSFHVWHGYWLW